MEENERGQVSGAKRRRVWHRITLTVGKKRNTGGLVAYGCGGAQSDQATGLDLHPMVQQHPGAQPTAAGHRGCQLYCAPTPFSHCGKLCGPFLTENGGTTAVWGRGSSTGSNLGIACAGDPAQGCGVVGIEPRRVPRSILWGGAGRLVVVLLWKRRGRRGLAAKRSRVAFARGGGSEVGPGAGPALQAGNMGLGVGWVGLTWELWAI